MSQTPWPFLLFHPKRAWPCHLFATPFTIHAVGRGSMMPINLSIPSYSFPPPGAFTHTPSSFLHISFHLRERERERSRERDSKKNVERKRSRERERCEVLNGQSIIKVAGFTGAVATGHAIFQSSCLSLAVVFHSWHASIHG